MMERLQKFGQLGNQTCFFWGPRQVGKSTLLRKKFPSHPYFNLLDPQLFATFQRRPEAFKEQILALSPKPKTIVMDEIQKIPALLDIIQYLIDEHGSSFILCGSSARKLKRGHANLLGGRAIRYELYPLVFKEIPQFDLLRALNHGLLPRHYLSSNPRDLIHAYVGDYLKEEIAAEGLTRNLPAFSRFLEASAFSNGEMVQYTNIASECGVWSSTVKEYFQILEDTLLGNFIPSFRIKPKRRVLTAPKFYFFDVGIVNFLLKRGSIEVGSEVFGKAFEHFIYQELAAHRSYSKKRYPISYWRTTSQLEVDFILGTHELALEVKGVEEVQPKHLKGLKAFQEEYKTKHSIIVSLDSVPRKVGTIDILPWRIFLERLWADELI